METARRRHSKTEAQQRVLRLNINLNATSMRLSEEKRDKNRRGGGGLQAGYLS